MDRKRTEAGISTLEQRRSLLLHAQALAEANQTGGFVAQIARKIGSDQLTSFEKRADAGKALRDIVDQYRVAAEFERTPIRRIIGAYHGFSLQVKVYPMFAPDIFLLLPGGERIDELHAETESGLFASADSSIRALPSRLTATQEEIQTKQQRLIDIDNELARMIEWEGQAAYDTALAELKTINDAFAALEAQAEEARRQHEGVSSVDGAAQEHSPPVAVPTTPAPGATTEDPITAVLALLSFEEGNSDEADTPITIPPAWESLAFMEEALRRQERTIPFSAAEPLLPLGVAATGLAPAEDEIITVASPLPSFQTSLFDIALPQGATAQADQATPQHHQESQISVKDSASAPVIVFGDRAGLGPAVKHHRRARQTHHDHEQVQLSLFES